MRREKRSNKAGIESYEVSACGGRAVGEDVTDEVGVKYAAGEKIDRVV
jgi:hypothetical protein